MFQLALIVGECTKRTGMQAKKKKNLSSLLNNTAAIKCALSHCVSHSVYNQIGEIKGGTAERDDGYLGEPARRHQSFQLRQLYDL